MVEKTSEEKVLQILSTKEFVLKDPNQGQQSYLTKAEAYQRSTFINNVKYRLACAPRKGGDSFLGNVIIDFDLAENVDNKECLFIDYKGRCMNSFKVNGTAVTDMECYKN
jgi:hypothetical protein